MIILEYSQCEIVKGVPGAKPPQSTGYTNELNPL